MTSFHLQITTPDGCLFDGEAQKVFARTIDGDVCILARHTNYVTALGYGEARITIDDTVRRAACVGGMLTVLDGRVRLVATTFEWAEDIDANRAALAKENAEKLMNDKIDKREQAVIDAKLKRALVRLRVKR